MRKPSAAKVKQAQRTGACSSVCLVDVQAKLLAHALIEHPAEVPAEDADRRAVVFREETRQPFRYKALANAVRAAMTEQAGVAALRRGVPQTAAGETLH